MQQRSGPKVKAGGQQGPSERLGYFRAYVGLSTELFLLFLNFLTGTVKVAQQLGALAPL